MLTRDRLDDIVPIGNAAMEDRTFIEWDKDDIDALGMMKVDVLALGMLTCIRKAFDLIAEHDGERYDLADRAARGPGRLRHAVQGRFDRRVPGREPGADEHAAAPEARANSTISSSRSRSCGRGRSRATWCIPICGGAAGQEKVVFPSPSPEHGPADELDQVLGKTMGVPLFQEQAMQLAIVAAKFTPEEANGLRRAMATFRNVGTIHTFREKMVGGMIARGYEPDFAERCFEQIEGFGTYGFPESHAASFAHLVYVSAWIKCHHPAAFACALLNSQPMGFYAPAQIVRDAREHGVEVRAPDVNHSHWDNTLEPVTSTPPSASHEIVPGTSPVNGGGKPAASLLSSPARGGGVALSATDGGSLALRLGLRQIGGFREAWATDLVEKRSTPRAPFSIPPPPTQQTGNDSQTHLPPRGEVGASHRARRDGAPGGGIGSSLSPIHENGFASIDDVQRRTALPKAALILLAEADAFRSIGLDRREALWKARRLNDEAALPLFAALDADEQPDETIAPLPAMKLSEHVIADYQTLRLSLKAYPTEFLRELFTREGIMSCAEIGASRDGDKARVAGIVLVRQMPGAKGVVFITLSDETGICNIVVWPSVFARFRKEAMGARLLVVEGKIQRSPEDVIHLVAERMVDRTKELNRLTDDEPPRSSPADNQMHKHPRQVRVLPKSRDFH